VHFALRIDIKLYSPGNTKHYSTVFIFKLFYAAFLLQIEEASKFPFFLSCIL